jgi:hypothetical protein
MKKRKTMKKYTKETTEMLVMEYEKSPSRQTVAFLAEKLNLSEKSIIGKLSKEGVYRRHNYVSKAGDPPVSKLELVSHISEKLGVEESKLVGLEKCPKSVLKEILSALET